MTPKFITPCYVRVEDKDKRKEVCEQLENMGYAVYLSATLDTFYWICTYLTDDNKYDPYILGEYFEDAPDNSIDCSTNIDLFLTLAGMRDDTDMGQRFVYADDIKFKCLSDNAENYLRKEVLSLGAGEDLLPFRRATAQEIVEHFSQEAV